MALYLETDVETDDGGEIQLENGDLKVATATRSHLQALNWLVMTDAGEGPGDGPAGNLGSFFGSMNVPRTHRAMEASLRQAVIDQRLFLPNDVSFRLTKVEPSVAFLRVTFLGEFFINEDEGETWDGNYQVLSYTFPFMTAEIVKIETPDAVRDL